MTDIERKDDPLTICQRLQQDKIVPFNHKDGIPYQNPDGSVMMPHPQAPNPLTRQFGFFDVPMTDGSGICDKGSANPRHGTPFPNHAAQGSGHVNLPTPIPHLGPTLKRTNSACEIHKEVGDPCPRCKCPAFYVEVQTISGKGAPREHLPHGPVTITRQEPGQPPEWELEYVTRIVCANCRERAFAYDPGTKRLVTATRPKYAHNPKTSVLPGPGGQVGGQRPHFKTIPTPEQQMLETWAEQDRKKHGYQHGPPHAYTTRSHAEAEANKELEELIEVQRQVWEEQRRGYLMDGAVAPTNPIPHQIGEP